jgi:4a-hydroxytetrahydrobiopterin dehydratase
MAELTRMKCVACRRGAAKVTDEEMAEFKPQIAEWDIIERDGMSQLRRLFKFKNFVQALEFTNKVGALAEEEDHHPALLTEWGRVTIRWWTHKIKGLHRNDLIAAAKTDQLYAAG